jgi:putative methanogenesis marker protein 7
MFKMYVFKGGIYRHDEIIDLIEDLGGIVMQKTPMQTEVDIVFALPEYDLEYLKDKAKRLKGEILDIPFGDMEIAIVSPSLSRHHLPHPVCDISEFLRRYGATTNIVGLARGYGKTIFQIADKEKQMVLEHDAAVFSFGIFEDCIRLKAKEVSTYQVPHVICGGPPELDGLENYIGDMGRKASRMRSAQDIATLEEIKKALQEKVELRRKEIEKDPYLYPPAYIKRAIEQQMGIKGSLGDNPVVLHLDGLRIKLPFAENLDRVKAITLGETTLGAIATIKKSFLSDTILVKLLTKSELEEVSP